MVRLVEETARSDRQVAAALVAGGRFEAELVTVAERRREFDALLLAEPGAEPSEDWNVDDQTRLHRIMGVA